MADKILNINMPALKEKMQEMPKKVMAGFMKKAMATKNVALEKLLSGGITFTKKQLSTLERLQKNATGNKKTSRANLY